jgi:GT2 family glycosyltransferase
MSLFGELRVVIINYNYFKDTIECVDSLLEAGASLEQIIIVDNASTDGSVDQLRNRFGNHTTILENDKNLGYPGALNVGIPFALSNGAKWVLLMNNDVIVAPDFIQKLKEAVDKGIEYSMFGPLILYYSAPEIIWYLGYRLIPGTLIGVGSYRGRKVTNNLPDLVPMDLMHGCAMMVKKEVFKDIGYFDDSQMIYGDDADFSLRAKKAGYKAAVATEAKLWHKVSLTMNRQKPHTCYLRTRNTVAFYRKYSSGTTVIIMFCFTLGKNIISTLESVAKRHFDLIIPLWIGWSDGWRGNMQINRY